ncbi:LADA_0E05314g1_1 [Lachancea dasiensis]|uniref:Dynein heavy chain, cytoplasmic n=1 Tax=Lachancea dasiensis TaxID=1072105 RepID=A0A1G4JCM8_9SACH|nr:LADA_0E05314g1_1 [Lachancea dasiensis]
MSPERSLNGQTDTEFIYKVAKYCVRVASAHLELGSDGDEGDTFIKNNSARVGSFIADESVKFMFLYADKNGVLNVALQTAEVAGNEAKDGLLVTMVKSFPVLDPGIAAQKQIFALNTSPDVSLAALGNFMTTGISSLFEYAVGAGRITGVTDSSIYNMRSKIRGLTRMLGNDHVSILVPDLVSEVHPLVAEMAENGITITNAADLATAEHLRDSSFLNSLQTTVIDWTQALQRLVGLTRKVQDGTAADEVRFWGDYEKGLQSVQKQVNKIHIQLTLALLREARRSQTSFLVACDSITKRLKEIKSYNHFLGEIPVSDLQTAGSLDQLRDLQVQLGAALKKIRIYQYPISRSPALVELISQEFVSKIKELAPDLKNLDLESLDPIAQELQLMLKKWDGIVSDHTLLLRELIRKRGEKLTGVKIHSYTSDLKSRIILFLELKHGNQTLVSEVSRAGLHKYERDVYRALDPLQSINCLRCSGETWRTTHEAYLQNIRALEINLVRNIKSGLQQCESINEVFSVMDKIKPLLTRPRIRGGLQEHHKVLLSFTMVELSKLEDRLSNETLDSGASHLRDVSGASFHAIRNRAVRGRLNSIMSKLSVLLGDQWRQSKEGLELNAKCSAILAYTESNERAVQKWIADAENCQNASEEPIFKIQKRRAELVMRVNSERLFQSSFKEVRNLKWLGLPISKTLEKTSRAFRAIYPFAIELAELVDTFFVTIKRIRERPLLHALLADEFRKTLFLLRQCVNFTWEDASVNSSSFKEYENRAHLVKGGRALLVEFKVTCAKVISTYNDLEGLHDSLVLKIKEITDRQFSVPDLEAWVDKVQSSSDQIARARVGNSKAFQEFLGLSVCEALTRVVTSFLEQGRLPKRNHSLKVVGGEINISPPLEETKTTWTLYAQEILETALHVWKYYQTTSTLENDSSWILQDNDFSVRVSKVVGRFLQEQQAVLNQGYEMFDAWRKYEALFTVSLEKLFERQPEDLEHTYLVYDGLLEDTREIIGLDSHLHVCASFSISIHHIRSEVHKILKNWRSMIKLRLTLLYSQNSSDFDLYINQARKLLQTEYLSLELSSVNKFHEIVIKTQEIQKNWAAIEKRLYLLHLVHKVLGEGEPYREPPSMDQLDFDVKSLKQIMEKRSEWFGEKRPEVAHALQKCRTALSDVATKIENLWEEKKHKFGEESPNVVLTTLNALSVELEAQRSRAIKLDEISSVFSVLPVDYRTLNSVYTDVIDHIKSWEAISEKWSTLDSLKGQLWTELNVDVIIRILHELLSGEECSAEIVFQKFSANVHSILSSHNLLKTLKYPGLRQHHWNVLFAECIEDYKPGEQVDISALTLSDILSLNLNNNEQVIVRVSSEARSELLISETLAGVDQRWKEMKFKYFHRAQGILLVKEWKHIFEAITDDLDTISSMKNSPHHQPFEVSRLNWEERLNHLAAVLTNWAEAQELWLRLDGVLDICSEKHSLRPEATKFKNVTSDFKSLLSHVFESELVFDIIGEAHVPLRLSSILDSLKKIMGSLDDYLERQREQFPRLYFLGNEDLLQLLGAVKDLPQASVHLSKLFNGVARLVHTNNIIQGLESPEGELLSLQPAIEVGKHLEMKDWLLKVENSIKSSILFWTERCLENISTRGLECFEQTFDQYIFQALLLSLQIRWTTLIENDILSVDFASVSVEVTLVLKHLKFLLQSSTCKLRRKKAESLVIDCLHFKWVLEKLVNMDSRARKELWSNTLKYYLHERAPPLEKIKVKIASHTFHHGLEYIGVPERLVCTPLLQNCFIAMSHALAQKRGGAPFGPAGTGKTESIKAFGQNLGRMVLVFNCDRSFDFHSMCRLLLGIAQVGAWGCFDEFNRLDENTMSAVSSQIGEVQHALSAKCDNFSLLGKISKLSRDTGLFVTMNIGYSGRRELPDNLKKKFRQFSMKRPDNIIIGEMLLETLGFTSAVKFARKLSTFLEYLEQCCSGQKHYDFGLRMMKAVVRNCRVLKIAHRQLSVEEILYQSLQQLLMPRLTEGDELIFEEACSLHFPHLQPRVLVSGYIDGIRAACKQLKLMANNTLLQKCTQFLDIQQSQQAVIISGLAGIGKTTVWKAALKAMEVMDQVENVTFVIDIKVLTKEELYGSLDPVTYEWSDGLFTSILRKVNQDQFGRFQNTRVWIIFDGDLDPEYAEAINSVLDDNKLLTLPNGERLDVPLNLSIIFEVENLQGGTPATISRCAVLTLNQFTATPAELLKSFLTSTLSQMGIESQLGEQTSLQICNFVHAEIGSIILELYAMSEGLPLTINIGISGVVRTFVSLTSSKILRHIDAIKKISKQDFELFLRAITYSNIVWAFTGACDNENRKKFESFFREKQTTTASTFAPEISFTDYFILPGDGNVTPISTLVPRVSLEPSEILNPDLMITTIETLKHEQLVLDHLQSGNSSILCGPPGSGKTMTLFNALKKTDRFELVGLTFSKETSVATVLKTLKHHTTVIESVNEMIMMPKHEEKDIVVFCDEINLPHCDNNDEQPVILLLRQIIEKNGLWDLEKGKWIRLERIRFVGACNPPDGASRKILSRRFTRFTHVLFVDYPSGSSLSHIYKTVFRATLKLVPDFREYYEELANASLEIYHACQSKFSMAKHFHYIFSPRDLTRWTKGIYAILSNTSVHELYDLLIIWIHEGLRLFSDRLVDTQDKKTFEDIMHGTILKFFPNQLDPSLNIHQILLSDWIGGKYQVVTREKLAKFVLEKLRVYEEEESECHLILHNNLIDHIVRVDRALKQEQGHCILVGPSRSAKRALVRFVSWLNGMEIVQLVVHRNFHITEFDKLLKLVMTKCAIRQQRVTLMVDDSSILESTFIERMNTLLANSDIPGLFEGEERMKLMSDLSTKAAELGLLLDSDEELHHWFTELISKNLHVAFTINNPESKNALNVISSPALFNRCVLDWIGAWPTAAFVEIGREVLKWMPFQQNDLTKKVESPPTLLIDEIIQVALQTFTKFQSLSKGIVAHGKYLDHLTTFCDMFLAKTSDLETSQRFIVTGLDTLKESVLNIREMSLDLVAKEKALKLKEDEARRTLDTMLSTQNEAERKHEATVEIRKILGVQEKELRSKKLQIVQDLELVEPEILEAQRGVNNIKKQHMTEVRSMLNPPQNVKLTLEAVCFVLGHSMPEWKDIQQFVRKDDFISSIVHYDTDHMMTSSTRSYLETKYLSNPNFNYEAVNHASRACGPLFQWVVAQVKYSSMLSTVMPLKESAEEVERDIFQAKTRLLAAEDMISDYQKIVEDSKLEYGEIIREKELIKTELAQVQKKVSRSEKLLHSLSTEKSRWKGSIMSFGDTKKCLVGDSFISSLYMTYCVGQDEITSNILLSDFKRLLTLHNIAFSDDYKFSHYVVDYREKSLWHSKGLPSDDMSVGRFHAALHGPQYPFIIDPDGNITNTIINHYGTSLTVTSFLDSGFIKRLKNCLRFGGPILIQDGEYFDPIISVLIAKELKKVGGKEVVKLGEDFVDVASTFQLIISSKNPSCKISSFVRARMTVLNFTIDKHSLASQILEQILAHEMPELCQQRKELNSLNGEYKLRLTNLERELLEALSETGPTLLENDFLIQTLEQIKIQTSEIEGKMRETRGVIDRIEASVSDYRPLSVHAFTVYSILEQLSDFHWSYHISIQSFLDCSESIFGNCLAQGKTRPDQLLLLFYQSVFKMFSPGLTQEHRVTLATLLFVSYYEPGESSSLSNVIHDLMVTLCKLPSTTAEDSVSHCKVNFKQKAAENYAEELKKAVGTDTVFSAMLSCMKLFGDFSVLDLEGYVSDWGKLPVLMLSEKGTDGSYRINQLATEDSNRISVISLGSKESTAMAEEALSRCSQSGTWLVLQNLQMSPEWVQSVLSKRIENLKADSHVSSSFKLFMTCEFEGGSLPLPLVRECWHLLHNSEGGILESAQDVWGMIPHTSNPPRREMLYLQFLLSWLHALLVEFTRLCPLGFSKRYDFNDADFEAGVYYLETVFQNVQLQGIPWDELRFNIGSIIYGGKIDNEEDQAKCKKLAGSIFDVKALSPDFELAPGVPVPEYNERSSWINFQSWLKKCQLPSSYSKWLGISENVEKEKQKLQADKIARLLVRLLNDA